MPQTLFGSHVLGPLALDGATAVISHLGVFPAEAGVAVTWYLITVSIKGT